MAGLLGNAATAAESKDAMKKPTPAESPRFAQTGGDFNWKPHKLDLDEVTSVAHAGYHRQGIG